MSDHYLRAWCCFIAAYFLTKCRRYVNFLPGYVQNEINKNKDLISYNEEDSVSKSNLENLEHIKFCLSFLTDSFNKTLRSLI